LPQPLQRLTGHLRGIAAPFVFCSGGMVQGQPALSRQIFAYRSDAFLFFVVGIGFSRFRVEKREILQ